mmetsp:Transcript_67686/g.220376  ORF Transcript_67686/g.220376 Transcript_67686/m.220376 type:complete len:256 (+) Transcript_67686:1226-1993(+)
MIAVATDAPSGIAMSSRASSFVARNMAPNLRTRRMSGAFGSGSNETRTSVPAGPSTQPFRNLVKPVKPSGKWPPQQALQSASIPISSSSVSNRAPSRTTSSAARRASGGPSQSLPASSEMQEKGCSMIAESSGCRNQCPWPGFGTPSGPTGGAGHRGAGGPPSRRSGGNSARGGQRGTAEGRAFDRQSSHEPSKSLSPRGHSPCVLPNLPKSSAAKYGVASTGEMPMPDALQCGAVLVLQNFVRPACRHNQSTQE